MAEFGQLNSIFQSLEENFMIFPIVGNFLRRFSNRWKKFGRFFQSLENGRGRNGCLPFRVETGDGFAFETRQNFAYGFARPWQDQVRPDIG